MSSLSKTQETIAKISLTLPIDINVPTKQLLAVETEFFCFNIGKFE